MAFLVPDTAKLGFCWQWWTFPPGRISMSASALVRWRAQMKLSSEILCSQSRPLAGAWEPEILGSGARPRASARLSSEILCL